jgi:hypothetical protein
LLSQCSVISSKTDISLPKQVRTGTTAGNTFNAQFGTGGAAPCLSTITHPGSEDSADCDRRPCCPCCRVML